MGRWVGIVIRKTGQTTGCEKPTTEIGRKEFNERDDKDREAADRNRKAAVRETGQ